MEEKKISEKGEPETDHDNDRPDENGRWTPQRRHHVNMGLPYDAAWTWHLRTDTGYKHTAMESALVELTLCWFSVVIFI